jgi:lantibiotic modifying enzyme
MMPTGLWTAGLVGMNISLFIEWASSRGEPAYWAQAEEAAVEGLRLYGASGNWPCGTIQGDTPGLMLGRAGIGYFYLRLADPNVPSVLLIDPPAGRDETLLPSQRCRR